MKQNFKGSQAEVTNKALAIAEKNISNEEGTKTKNPKDLANLDLHKNKLAKLLNWRQKFTRKPKFLNPLTNNKYTKGFLKNRDWNGRLQLPDISLGFGVNVIFSTEFLFT